MEPKLANNGRRKGWQLSSTGVASVVALLIVMQTSSSARVYVRIAPPVPIVEVAPPPPGPEYFWVPGFWIWDGAHYVWRHSHYVLRPHPGAVWAPGHWDHHARGWYWVPGHWR
jgi:hypothetical protein